MTNSQAAVPTEEKAAQTLLVPMECIGLGENYASVDFLSNDAMGMCFVERAEFGFEE